LDVVQDQLEKAAAKNVQVIRAQSAVLEVEPTGFCLFCEEVVGTTRWCGALCRDLWERDRKKHAKLQAQARL
jgi:predicted nucleic acid-binding Zn ribbon protein